MIWYSSGTVTVTQGSGTVIGAGTSFSANVNIGDAFIGPDQVAYEVTDVVNNTEITISPVYIGSTASAQSYRIQPTRGLIAQFVSEAQSLLSTIQGYVNSALAGLFSDGTVGAPGISFVNDTDTGVRRVAANTLAMVAGGADHIEVNPTDGLKIKGTLAYRRGNILAAVAQSGGVPTGGIIERGSNGNGEFVRFADGTQIVMKRLTLLNQDINTAVGSVFTSGNLMAGGSTMAAAFASGTVPAITMSARISNYSSAWQSAGGQGTGAVFPGTLYCVSPQSLTDRTIYLDLIAVGRWF